MGSQDQLSKNVNRCFWFLAPILLSIKSSLHFPCCTPPKVADESFIRLSSSREVRIWLPTSFFRIVSFSRGHPPPQKKRHIFFPGVYFSRGPPPKKKGNGKKGHQLLGDLDPSEPPDFGGSEGPGRDAPRLQLGPELLSLMKWTWRWVKMKPPENRKSFGPWWHLPWLHFGYLFFDPLPHRNRAAWAPKLGCPCSNKQIQLELML